MEIQGPPMKIKNHVDLFKKKHKKTFIKNNKIFSLEKRKFTNAKKLIEQLIINTNIEANVKNITLI